MSSLIITKNDLERQEEEEEEGEEEEEEFFNHYKERPREARGFTAT